MRPWRPKRESLVANVQFCQEIGGLVGRFVLATLAMFIVSRRLLLWIFQVPGLLLLPLVFYFPGAGRLPDHNVEWLKAGIFLAGLFTVAQFSYWGNYLPLVYPMRLAARAKASRPTSADACLVRASISWRCRWRIR